MDAKKFKMHGPVRCVPSQKKEDQQKPAVAVNRGQMNE